MLYPDEAFRETLAVSLPEYLQRYVPGCYRYIEMNPVRANLIRHPVD